MKVRTFKVMEPGFADRGAHIRFRGQWLVKAGFAPGALFHCENPAPGTLTLTIANPTGAAATFADTLAAFNRLDPAPADVPYAEDINDRNPMRQP